MDMSIIPSRNAPYNKAMKEIYSIERVIEITNGKPVYLHYAFPSHRTVFYYSKKTRKVLERKDIDEVKSKDVFFLVQTEYIPLFVPKDTFETAYKFKSNNINISLIKYAHL